MGEKIGDITVWLEFIIAIISVVGAIVSLFKAKNIKKDVEYIREVKKEIIEREKIEEIAKVREEITKIKSILKGYFFTKKKATSFGRSFSKDIESIKSSLTVIKENRYIFTDINENKSDLIYLEVNSLVNKMIDYENNEEELSRFARDLDTSLDNFLASLKELNNNKKYR